ncbi:type II toxin-antitoxin system VapC family toxin [Haloarcula halophila]|uniref:type II toxin-antitoxin system VapC family toxin n=1 Tax=Haloarcula TaxID=2237 RepID=UPI0023E3BD0B|nr:type II toxin-antitoxin system VapC family toxin [Halomicroarcula sp. DFY41]
MDTLVPDANVLIAFYKVDWFDSIAFWRPEYDIEIPQAVWDDEFAATREVSRPEWIELVEVESAQGEDRSNLSVYDWKCLEHAEQHDGILITRDKPLKEMAENLDVDVMWSAKFLMTTFEGCGIKENDYRNNLDPYLEDAYLPPVVHQELHDAEK